MRELGNASTDEDLQVVAGYYDSVANGWDETYGIVRQNSIFTERFHSELKHLLASACGAPNGLELGAGTGAYVSITAPFFERLLATDLSEGMLEMFRRRLLELGIENVDLQRLDALDLEGVADASMDAVYSLGLLETLPDLDRHFAECARVLKPGGAVLGITSNGDCPWYALRWLLQGGSRHCRQRDLARPRMLEARLKAAGFVDFRPKIWGAVPPGMRNQLIAGFLNAVEKIVERTPVRAYLGVMSFAARKGPSSAV